MSSCTRHRCEPRCMDARIMSHTPHTGHHLWGEGKIPMNEGEIHSISMSKSKSKVAITSMQELASSELAKLSLNIFIFVYHMPTGTSHSRLLSTHDQLGVMLRHFRCCFPFSVTVIEAQLNSNNLVPSPPLLLTKWPRKEWSGIFGPIPWLSPSPKKDTRQPFPRPFC